MKPVARKTLLTATILTAAFSFVFLTGTALDNGESPGREVIGVAVMGLALLASTFIWALGTPGSDDHRGKR